MTRGSAWGLFHPSVPMVYLAAVLAMAMALMHPVLSALSFAAAISYSFILAGAKPTFKLLAWQIPLALVIGIANMVFSASGSTELLRIGERAFYLESLVYGLTSGCMLSSVMMWFSCGNKVLDSDQVLLVGAKRLPTVSLMVSMALRLVPQFVRRGAQINDARLACTAAGSGAGRVKRAARQSTVLMSWAMEDSLETADSMRCRGWESGCERSAYELREMHRMDWALLIGLLLLIAIAIVCGWQLICSFAFYPRVSSLGDWYLYLPYVILLFVPHVLEVLEWLRWR